MAAERHAEIAGAGFAGLAAATALSQRGWTVRVHEADTALRAFGAGIHIWNNGRLGLRTLGALAEVEDGALWPAAYETRTNNVITSSEALNAPGKDPFLAVTRQHLHAAMVAAARRAGADIVTRLGASGRYDAYETTKLERWSEGRVAIIGDAAHAMPPTLGQGANSAICNALGLAVALDERTSVQDALQLWESRERPLTDHTQRRAGEIAGTRVLAGGMNWDDEGMRAARGIPTGTRELVMG